MRLRNVRIFGSNHQTDGFAADLKRNVTLFGFEGLFLALVQNLINNNNNLFAIRLGASDIVLGLVSSVPQIVSMAVLLPGGVLANKLRHKRKMVIGALAAVAALYLMIGFSFVLPGAQLPAFVALLSLSAGGFTLYGLSWNTYFSDVIGGRARNAALAMRTRFWFLAGILVLLVSGTLLASTDNVAVKQAIHRGFFFFAAAMICAQIFLLIRVKEPAEAGGVRKEKEHAGFKQTVADVFGNKLFLAYCGVAIFFYCTWMPDWAMYTMSQLKYLQINEQFIGIALVGTFVSQFLSVKIWSRQNERRGPEFGMAFAALGLAGGALGFYFAMGMPVSVSKWFFLCYCIVVTFFQTPTTLNPLQCLLRVLPERNKAILISVYTILQATANAVIPMVGVMFYNRLGGDLSAMRNLYKVLMVLRLFAMCLWFLWSRYMRRRPAGSNS